MLDLAFAMDCTGSMGSYNENAKNNIRSIVAEITTKEHITIRLALIEYRDHPPQDNTFVTRTHGFTNTVEHMTSWLDQCSAQGGGDAPEAVADALNDALNLEWSSAATKICILISDAPPHGLNPTGDSFPSGCPAGHDPMTIVRKMAEKSITLYTVGVEPPIVPYREFFMALAHITGGQYVPMVDANRLAQMIIAGAREEISLNRLMDNARTDIVREMRSATRDGIDDQETAARLQRVFNQKKMRVNRMNNGAGGPSKDAEECYAKCLDMAEMQRQYKMPSSTLASTVTTTPMDYNLQEETDVTIEQAKRIVQKAKTWDYSSVETRPTRRPVTLCRYGEESHDFSSHHREKYKHPSNDSSTSQRHRPSQRETHSSKTSCKYGEKCYDHSEYHRAKYTHPANNNDRRIPCRYGSDCHDYSEYHRDKYTHPRR